MSSRKFSRHVVLTLEGWLLEHLDYPYPNGEEVGTLMEKTGLRAEQIGCWMRNLRRRRLSDMRSKERVDALGWRRKTIGPGRPRNNSGTAHGNREGRPKRRDAQDVNTDRACTLIVADGLSGMTAAIGAASCAKILNICGAFAMQGKLANVRKMSRTENVVIKDLTVAIGLEHGKVYTSLDDLRYQKIVIMTDPDEDGAHITALFVNFIHNFWPSLLRLRFLTKLMIPYATVQMEDGEASTRKFHTPYELRLHSAESGRPHSVKRTGSVCSMAREELAAFFTDLESHCVTLCYEDGDDECIRQQQENRFN